MASRQDTGVGIINASDLLGGIRLNYDKTQGPDVEADDVYLASEGSPLTQVAAALKESFYSSSWAMAGRGAGAAAGVSPEVYTTALRAALIEYGGNAPVTLSARLRAADGLASLLGMSGGAHETLLLRALAANERLVMELQAQAAALRSHRVGLTSSDFVSKAAYATWRARALRAVRAVLLAQQRMPEYNALLEVSLLGAKELAAAKKGGGGFMCCFKPDEAPLCPYAWAHMVVPAGGASLATTPLGTRTQRTQVLTDSGANPSWQAVLQPLTLTSEECELRLKVSNCVDARGQPKASHDKVLGVSGIKLSGLQPAVTQQVMLPLYAPPPHSRPTASSSGAPTGPNDTEPNVFFRVVYDPETDEVHGSKGLEQQGRLVLQLRYIVERRTRYAVPDEETFCGDPESDGESDTEVQSNLTRPSNTTVGTRGQSLAVDAVETLQTALDTVVDVGKNVVDYLQHITTALAQGLVDNPLAMSVRNGFNSRVKGVTISLVTEPLNLPRTPSITKLSPTLLLKQLAAALAGATKAGKHHLHAPANAAIAFLPMLPAFPEELKTLLLSPSRRGTKNKKQQQQPAPWDAKKQPGGAGAGRSGKSGAPLPPAPSGHSSTQQEECANATQEMWSLLEDAMVKPYLPLGPSIAILVRASALLCVRVETVLILVVQHMLDDWPNYIGSTIRGRNGPVMSSGGGALSDTVELGGAQDYLHALRVVWEKCLTWHTLGTLTLDETEGVKGVMGLMLSRVLPALEQHYTVFVGKEGAVCFTMLLEMVGWAWTWDPKAPVPYSLLTEYLKDAATHTMKMDFRPSAATLPQDVETLVHEIEDASECLKRDRDIQLTMPGLRGFAACNAAARYELLYDHLEAVMLYQPGNSLQAMQTMFDLEVVLLEHHRLLVAEGFASPLPPAPVPRHLLPRLADASSPPLESVSSAVLPEALPSRVEPGHQDEFESNGFERGSAGSTGAGRSPAIRKGNRHAPVIPLWDWENMFIEELCRWVRTGVADLHTQVLRLLAGETWAPASKVSGVAASSLELSRLVEASMTSWLDAACSGSEARRLNVGVLITACLSHIHYEYIAGTVAWWDKDLEARAGLFTAVNSNNANSNQRKVSAAGAGPEHKRNSSVVAVPTASDAGPHQGVAASASPLTNPFTGNNAHPSPSLAALTPAPFMPGLSAASAPVMVRVVSLAVGMGTNSQNDSFTSFINGPGGNPLPSATAPPGPRHGHKRSTSQSTAFASTAVLGQFKDVVALRGAAESALAALPGMCLTKQMCVVRTTLHKVSQEAHDIGAHLLQCLVAPFLKPGQLPNTGSGLLEAAARRNGTAAVGGKAGNGRKTIDTDSDDDDGVPVRPSLSSMRSVSANDRSSLEEPAWGKKRGATNSNTYASQIVRSSNNPTKGVAADPDPAGWGRKKPAKNALVAAKAGNGAAAAAAGGNGGGRDGRDSGAAKGNGDAGAAAKRGAEAGSPEGPPPISNFVGAYWHELQRRTSAVITTMVSSYSVTLRSALVSLMVASCGVKPGEPVNKKILEGLMTAVDDEMGVMREGLGREVPLCVEEAGALWRAATSALQLLALNQAGFRPLGEEECELLRQLLLSLQQHYQEEVPKMARTQGVEIEMEQVAFPHYPQQLAARLSASHAPHPSRTFTLAHGARALPPELLASLDLVQRPPPEDPSARRAMSGDYCAALLQLACAPAGVLQDLFRAQEASLHAAQHGVNDKAVYVPLGPQQLPLLDLLRLMRARRKAEPTSAAWADGQLKDSGAVITQVLFGLVGTERVVAEFKCVLAGASRQQGRLIVTQGTLCFTTMLDADLKSLTDTSLSLLRAKVVSVAAGSEPGSLVISTTDHDILAFTSFSPPSERERLVTLLTAPAHQPQGTAGGAGSHGSTPPTGNSRNGTPQKPAGPGAAAQGAAVAVGAGGWGTAGVAAARAAATASVGAGSAPSAGAASRLVGASGPAAAGAGAAVAASAAALVSTAGAAASKLPSVALDPRSLSSATASGSAAGSTSAAAGRSLTAGKAGAATAGAGAAAGAAGTRRPPSRDPWAAREAAERAEREGSAGAVRGPTNSTTSTNPTTAQRQELVALPALPAEAPAPPPAPAAPRGGATSAGGTRAPSPVPPPVNHPQPPQPPQPPIMSVPCSLYGMLSNRDGVFSLYDDRLEFVGVDGAMVHQVALVEVAAVTQMQGMMGGNRLVVKVDSDAAVNAGAQLQFTGLSDAMIASLKQSIIDLT